MPCDIGKLFTSAVVVNMTVDRLQCIVTVIGDSITSFRRRCRAYSTKNYFLDTLIQFLENNSLETHTRV